MAGYDGWSQSNNALAAKSAGKWPLGKAIGVVAEATGATKAAARRALVSQGPCEWHHTSKHFNATDFFDTAHAIRKLQASEWIEAFNAVGGAARIDAALDPARSLAERHLVANAAKAQIAAEIGATSGMVTSIYYDCWEED